MFLVGELLTKLNSFYRYITVSPYSEYDICINLFDLQKEGTNIKSDIEYFLNSSYVAKHDSIKNFINILLSNNAIEYLYENYHLFQTAVPKKINVEFVSANPTGVLHAGNIRGAFLGNAISGLLEMIGNKVTKEYYVNDLGGQVSTLTQAYVNNLDNYPKSIQLLKENNIKQNEESIVDFFVDLIKKQCDSYNVQFDIWSSEKKIMNNYLNNIAIQSFLKTISLYDENNRAYIQINSKDRKRYLYNQDNIPTYLLRDIMYMYDKKIRGYDTSIMLVGSDHNEYVQSIKYIASKMNFDVITKEIGRVLFDNKSFSKRIGNTPSVEEIFNNKSLMQTIFLKYKANSHIDIVKCMQDDLNNFQLMSKRQFTIYMYEINRQLLLFEQHLDVHHIFSIFLKLNYKCEKANRLLFKLSNAMGVIK